MTKSNTGAGNLRRKLAAQQARWDAEKAVAQAKLAADRARLGATQANTATAPTPAPGAPLASPQSAPVATVLSAPPAPSAGADPADLAILAKYNSMTWVEALTYLKENEPAILRARANVPADTGRFRHLHGLARTIAATRIAQ